MEIDIKSSTAEKLIDIGNDFLQKFAGPSAIEKGLIWGDNMKLRRLENQINNFEKIKNIVAQGKVKLKQIDLKALVPYLEGVSLEEDEKLQDLWANLFVNYIDADKNLEVNVYPKILGQISIKEIEVMQKLLQVKFLQVPSKPHSSFPYSLEVISNLERLGLIVEKIAVTQPNIRHGATEAIQAFPSGDYSITPFGKHLIKACQRE